jgi:hypothetical protein
VLVKSRNAPKCSRWDDVEPYDGIRDRFSSSKDGESDNGGGSSRDSAKIVGSLGRSQMLLREGKLRDVAVESGMVKVCFRFGYRGD